MKLKILGWSSAGFRCPDVKIDLRGEAGSPPKKISLLQMPNGTGKTTTLDLLRAAMNGKAVSWAPETVRDFKRPGSDRDEAVFELMLSVDGQPLTFEMSFDFFEGKVAYQTSRPGSGGVEDGYNPPIEVRRFLDNRFIELFFFNGELATDLLEKNKTAADNAIYSMCHLYLFDDMETVSSEVEQKIIEGAAGGKTSQGLSRARNELQNLQAREKSLIAAQNNAEAKLKNIEKEITEWQGKKDQLDSNHEEVKQKKEEADADALNWRNEINLANLELMAEFRSPHKLNDIFRNKLVELKNGLDSLKLPETTSKEFFSELSREPQCICGRPIGDTERNTILENAKKYMGSETAGVLNAFKSQISDFSDTDNQVSELLDNLKLYLKNESAAKTLAAMLGKQLAKLGGDEADEINKKLDELHETKDKLSAVIEAITRSKDDPEADDNCLAWVQVLIKEKKDTIAIITNTLSERRKHEILDGIFNRAVELSKENLKSAIIESSNEKLKRVLKSDVLQIAAINECLSLQSGQSGASVGQTLAIGYCFLTTLLERGNHEFPLVVDSPCGAMDEARRRAIGGVIPNVCTQFLSFILNTECPYFVDSLEKNSGHDDIRYMTAFRRTEGTQLMESGLPNSGVTKSQNGVLVIGKEYFDNFELEEEI
jgi:DNA sulfur modification protein DndD